MVMYLDNKKKDIGLYVLFRTFFKTFQVNFQDISVTHNKSGIYFTGVSNLYGHLL